MLRCSYDSCPSVSFCVTTEERYPWPFNSETNRKRVSIPTLGLRVMYIRRHALWSTRYIIFEQAVKKHRTPVAYAMVLNLECTGSMVRTMGCRGAPHGVHADGPLIPLHNTGGSSFHGTMNRRYHEWTHRAYIIFHRPLLPKDNITENPTRIPCRALFVNPSYVPWVG